jgi:glycosyltransferase involved in cell wall biosynthesis
VGLLGLISPRKHQLVAAEAVAIARRRGAPVRLLLAGDPFKTTVAYGEALRERLKAGDLADAVRWLPFQRDVLPLYGAMDVNLLISAEEGFGRTIIEAGAIGVPSVGSRIGGIPELIEEGETGWLVDDGSAEQLADVLVRAHEDREGLRRMGEAAERHVWSTFSIEAHVGHMVSVWNEARE